MGREVTQKCSKSCVCVCLATLPLRCCHGQKCSCNKPSKAIALRTVDTKITTCRAHQLAQVCVGSCVKWAIPLDLADCLVVNVGNNMVLL